MKGSDCVALFEVGRPRITSTQPASFFPIDVEQFTPPELLIAQLIQRRRLQLLVHSYLYYKRDLSLISDETFDEWARELVRLQYEYPEVASKVCYAEAFRTWDASTGAFLPLSDNWVIQKASQLAARGGLVEYKKIQQSPGKPSSQNDKRKAPSKQRGNPLF